MHLHVKHLGLGDSSQNVAVDCLVLKQINPLMAQMQNHAKVFWKYFCLASIPDLSVYYKIHHLHLNSPSLGCRPL